MSSDELTEPWPSDLVALYEDRLVAMVRLAYLIVGEGMVAEEVVHEAFIRCRDRWSYVRSPEAYLRTAVVNGARSWLRSADRERRRQPPAAEPAALEPDEMWDALARLEPRQRIAIVLRFYDGLSDVDIAECLDCRPATVRSLVHRGVRQLRKEIVR